MFNWMTFVSIVVVCGTDFTYSMKYRPFQNEETGHFGLKNRRNTPCLVLKFDAKLYIFDENYMNTTVQIPKLSSSNVKIHGYCAANDSRKQPAKISAVWLAGNSTKKLTLLFSAARMRSSVKQLSEVRWLLKSITLSSLDEGKITEKTSDEVIMSAPLKQKYVCRDKLNVTLKSNNQTSTILEMQPIIEAQPYNAAVTYANSEFTVFVMQYSHP
ncbi:hypothetical protein AB6A40_006757 [Gnathostoma spinigerum]|uniref:Uncharacterized protein n=1 Tax=Gnathostoma spinigerum TaxID=75299 RepID=A0ABD6EJ96_9BILA